MDDILIEAKDIIFRSTEYSDLNRVLEIETNPENSRFVYNWSKERHIEAINSSTWMHICIINANSHEIIGYALLDGIKNEDNKIELTRIVISDKGKGYGRQSIEAVKKLCFEELNCHRLWLDVFDYNYRAIELYKSQGFIQEGILRECKKVDGKYESMRIFSMLRNEYFR